MPTHLLKVDQENNKTRLDVFLVKNLPDVPSRSFIKKLIESQNVAVNGRVVKVHHQVLAGDEVSVEFTEQAAGKIEPENINIEIFYEDEDIIVVNKPSGMTVHPAKGNYSGTLVNALLFHYKDLPCVNSPDRPGIVHRLDKETSGVLVVAKNNKAHVKIARQFEKRSVKKSYIALVSGIVEFDEGIIDASLGTDPRHREKKAVLYYGAKEAKTLYRVIKRYKDESLVALFPKTGRTHQLRVHMKHLGHPILGDAKYGNKNFERLALHAKSIGFTHPRTSNYVEFSTRLPDFLTKYNS